MKSINLCVIISGTGSNMLSLLTELKNEPLINFALIVSDNSEAVGIHAAKKLGYNCKVLDTQNLKKNDINFEELLHNILVKKNIQLICLAGFMKILSPWFVKKWKMRILNIHPLLLPKFKGLDTHSRVLKSKDEKHGCTVHYVNENVDDGEILGQSIVEISKDDTVDKLANKVLIEEHKLYPHVVKKLVKENYSFFTNKVR